MCLVFLDDKRIHYTICYAFGTKIDDDDDGEIK